MDTLILIQRWLYGGIGEGMRAATDMPGMIALVASTFLFGIAHAFMPGHGKSVLVSYHLGRPGKLVEGIATAGLLSLTHVGTAVLLVMAGVAVISRSVAAGGRAPAFDLASAILITLIGLYLVWRWARPGSHAHATDGKALAFVTGLVPCPLTTFILSYALAREQLAVGLLAVGAMLAGVTLTIASFAVAAIIARQRFMSLMASTEGWRERIGRSLEALGAVAVLLIGLAMLAGRIGRIW